MQESVPSSSAAQATFAATLFDEWIRCGLKDVVVCPGSRSTPLVLACASRSELNLHVRIDERGAGFFAIGRALITRTPVVVVVTSGTAAAELHAAVAEADLAGVPLLVLTGDRPPELHNVGAPQTIVQRNLYGPMVRSFEEPGVARMEASSSWRALASRLWWEASGVQTRPGPVHLNVAFVEPLVVDPLDLPPSREGGGVWRSTRALGLTPADLDVRGRRVLAVVGRGVASSIVEECIALDWVVLGDATSQLTMPYFDPLLRDDDFASAAAPDVIIRLGGLPASKALLERMAAWRVPVIALGGAGPVADPLSLVREVLPGLPAREVTAMHANADYVELWREASERVGAWLCTNVDNSEDLIEPVVARVIVEASTRYKVPLVIGSSMPVRDVEWWSPARESPTFANRGANGIDGVLSTVLGVASGARALGLVGDITMLHDVSALVDGLGEAGGRGVIVVVDNGGGGIFSFLPQAQALDDERFEQFFGTPRSLDLAGLARAFAHHGERVSTTSELRRAVDEALVRDGVSVVVATTVSRDENVRRHESMNQAIRPVWRPDVQ